MGCIGLLIMVGLILIGWGLAGALGAGIACLVVAFIIAALVASS